MEENDEIYEQFKYKELTPEVIDAYDGRYFYDIENDSRGIISIGADRYFKDDKGMSIESSFFILEADDMLWGNVCTEHDDVGCTGPYGPFEQINYIEMFPEEHVEITKEKYEEIRSFVESIIAKKEEIKSLVKNKKSELDEKIGCKHSL